MHSMISDIPLMDEDEDEDIAIYLSTKADLSLDGRTLGSESSNTVESGPRPRHLHNLCRSLEQAYSTTFKVERLTQCTLMRV